MVLGFLTRRDRRRGTLDRLHAAIVAAARAPVFYVEYGAPDTFEGRFELVTLHAVLVLRRLRALPEPAGDLAQDLVDTLFRRLDDSLREAGVGDLAVPKRMKRLAEAFYGRAQAYEAALAGGDDRALAGALGRNVLGSAAETTIAARRLVAYATEAGHRLATADISAFTAGQPPFPDPTAIRLEGQR